MNQVVDFISSERFAVYRNILSVLGAAYVFKKILRTVWSAAGGFRAYFLAPWGISRINLKKYGSWAIVTGASEGIGRCYAIQLAKQGLNVAILSRSEEKLEKVANEIRERYNREVRIVSVDFSQGQSVYDDIQAEISDLDVAVLVNNVGVTLKCPDITGDADEINHRNIIEVNCQSMVQMTHLVLPKMVEKNCGIIVNVSSMTSMQPTPLLNVYAATKKFVCFFSDGLRYEYKSKGIIVQTLVPGLVCTAMSHISKPGLLCPTPETYARAAVATIGIKNETCGYLYHGLQASIGYSIVPTYLSRKLLYLVMLKMREDILKQTTHTAT